MNNKRTSLHFLSNHSIIIKLLLIIKFINLFLSSPIEILIQISIEIIQNIAVECECECEWCWKNYVIDFVVFFQIRIDWFLCMMVYCFNEDYHLMIPHNSN